MDTQLLMPTVDEVKRIAGIKDPVTRNLEITQCYYELSAVLASKTGLAANWCTFATWASRQAGQTIRKEDLASLLERYLNHSPSTLHAAAALTAEIPAQRRQQFLDPQSLTLSAANFQSAVDRASDAVARGNKKVFEEIGYEFARFFQTRIFTQMSDAHNITRFCEELQDGDPPDGQGYLRRAFSHYAQALAERDSKTRAELILLANIEIGFHEQTRLQPEIAESLDAGMTSFLDFTRSLFRGIFPLNGWFHLAHLYLRRLLGRPTALDRAIEALLAEVRVQMRQVITDLMMTIRLPNGIVLRLGEDLSIGFPESLRQITCSELARFLEKYDLTPDSLDGTGALDWANLPERLHFILDLFRCYQENPTLFEPPFTKEQVEVIKAGQVPDGRL